MSQSDQCPGCGADEGIVERCGCIHFKCGSMKTCEAMQDVGYTGPFEEAINCLRRQRDSLKARIAELEDKLNYGAIVIELLQKERDALKSNLAACQEKAWKYDQLSK